MHADILDYLLLTFGIALFVIYVVNTLQFRAQ